MNLLSLPFVEAVFLLVKITVVFCWGVIMLSFAIRIILRSITDEIYAKEEED